VDSLTKRSGYVAQTPLDISLVINNVNTNIVIALPELHTFPESLVPPFRERLLLWYDRHARKLPWRQNRDPYRVWVSEIMLQQTRVAAVIAHYHEFLSRFPSVEKLSRARDASVLAAWSGLGYYRRARMLHAAARVIVRELDGKFPDTAAGWRELPGIGRYTAAAIASISSGEAAAVVDGNVERVLQRISGKRLAGEPLWKAAEEMLDRDQPGDFNQAMMELGAVVCTPRVPACLTCPVLEFCATRGDLPGATKPPRQQQREIHYALHHDDGKVLLVQRPPDARLMAGMWELPEIEPDGNRATTESGKRIPASRPDNSAGSTGGNRKIPEHHFRLRHSITVTDYTVYVSRLTAPPAIQGEWISTRGLGRTALTGLARKILRRAAIL
jgi:A/G-specific adenine glycosylase